MSERRKDAKNRVLKEGEYQRDNGTYEFKWRDKFGNRHSVYAKTLESLREKEIEVRRDISDGIKVKKQSTTINDLYHIWMKLKRGLKDNTFQTYKFMYEQYVEPGFGNMKIQDLKRTDVRAFYNQLKDEYCLKSNTVDCVHTVLHQVLELAVDDNLLRFNPADKAIKSLGMTHGEDATKRRALTVAEQDAFESFLCRTARLMKWSSIFTVMLWTGMRVGEVTGLRWCDVDFEHDTVDVNHTLVYYKAQDGKMRFAINTPKSDAGRRVVPMLSDVKAAILREKEYQKELGIKCNVTIDGYTDFIFVNQHGGVYHQATLNRALRRIVKRYNASLPHDFEPNRVVLPEFTNHSLRHTFATRMCEAGVNPKAMQEILGHADFGTTMDTYAEATTDLKKSELVKFEVYFRKDDPEKSLQNQAPKLTTNLRPFTTECG